ncbi:MAG: hypothetical protein JXA77_15145 [Bacteroidales bacterium]|nr:hypothetical protein [Bacteroidales bacterium]MBN2820203.1 hypothetical protein [Bacteroidales bacterium]
MKRAITVLAIMLTAATSFTQTSRRTASTNGSATRTETRSNDNTTTRSTSTKSADTKQSSDRNVESNRPTSTTRSTTTSTNRNSTTTKNNSSYERPVNNGNTRTSGNNTSTTRTTTATQNNNNRGHGTTTVNRSENEYRHPGNNGNGTRSTNPNGYYVSSRRYTGHHNAYHPHYHTSESRDYRAKHYVYREPVHVDIYWNRDMHRHYISMYPEVHYWNYSYGYRINRVSAYNADYYIGEVMNVYGRVSEVYYSRETDEYFLYMGPYYPYHDFTVIIPGNIARNYSRRPINYFTNQYLNVTGLITSFEGKPEVVVKRRFQLDVY